MYHVDPSYTEKHLKMTMMALAVLLESSMLRTSLRTGALRSTRDLSISTPESEGRNAISDQLQRSAERNILHRRFVYIALRQEAGFRKYLGAATAS